MELRVGVKILLKNKEGKFLVLQRSKVKYPEVGAKWEIAGGRINPGSTLIENLKREVMEETGLEILGDVKLVAVQDILRPNKDHHTVRITYSGKADGEVRLSDEHTNFKWVTKEELQNLEPMDSYFKQVLSLFS